MQVDLGRARLNPAFVDVDDAVLAPLLEVAVLVVEEHCNRHFEKQVFVETFDGEDTQTIFLKESPIASIASIACTDINNATTTYTVNGTDFKFNPMTSEVRLVDGVFFQGFQNITVTYTAGYDVIPENIIEAVVEVANLIQAENLHDPKVTSESLGEYSKSIAAEDGTLSQKVELPRTICKLLSRHRRFL